MCFSNRFTDINMKFGCDFYTGKSLKVIGNSAFPIFPEKQGKLKDRLPAVPGKRSRVMVFGFSFAERVILCEYYSLQYKPPVHLQVESPHYLLANTLTCHHSNVVLLD